MMRIGALALTFLVAEQRGIAANAREARPLEAVLSAAREAAGGDRLAQVQSLIIRSEVAQGGLKGRFVRSIATHDGRFREDLELGINHGSVGFDGRVAWSADAGGLVRREEAEEMVTRSINQAFRYAMGIWFSKRRAAEIEWIEQRKEADGSSYDIVAVRPAGGRLFHLWFNSQSHLAERWVEKGAFQTTTVFLSDYRAVEGIKFPFQIRTTNGETRFDRIEQVKVVTVNPSLPDAAFSAPPENSSGFSLPAGVTSVTIPFRLIANVVVLDVSINGREALPFVLDTGAVNILLPEAARALELHPEGSLWGFGAGKDSIETAQVKVDEFDMGNVHFGPHVFAVYPIPELSKSMGVENLGGLLGYEVFKRFVVTIDYVHRTATFALPAASVYAGNGTIMPFRFNGNIPELDGSVEGSPGRFHVDTGSAFAVVLYTPWVQQHRSHFGDAFEQAQTAMGAAGGEMAFTVANIDRFTVGGLPFGPMPVVLSLQAKGALANPYGAGLIGSGLLLTKRVTFDYPQQRLIIEDATK